MGTKYFCPYCDWSGWEPDILDYEDEQQFYKDLEVFKEEQKNHTCLGKVAIENRQY